MKTGFVFPGGGSKGSYQAGCLRALASLGLYSEGVSFVAGTSVGSMSALAFAHFAPGPDQCGAASDLLDEVWRGVRSNRDVYRPWFPPYLSGLWKPSVFHVEPLEALLRSVIRDETVRASGVELRMVAVDLLRSETRVFDQHHPDLVQAALASGSFTGALPPVAVDGGFYTDGGARDSAPLSLAIEAGCEEIVVFMCNPRDMEPVSQGDLGNAAQVAFRGLDILFNEVLRNDLKMCELVNELVDAGRAPGKRKVKLTVLEPLAPLGSTLSFDGAVIDAQLQQGYDDTVARLTG